jgi:YesN/AraC family two-component response regulator
VVKILIVEDEAIVARDMAEIMVAKGHIVLGKAGSCEEAILALEHDTPDLAVVDIRLGGTRDGIAFGLELREEHDIALAFVTSHADSHTLQRAMPLRPNGYLVKPFSDDELEALVLTAMSNHRSTRADVDTEQLAAANVVRQPRLPVQCEAKVQKYIACHLDRAISTQDLAGLCNMSAAVFSRRFIASFGSPPYRYIVRERLAEAKRLLRNTNWSIVDVALASGFCNQQHFTTVFRKYAGVTPLVYRKLV